MHGSLSQLKAYVPIVALEISGFSMMELAGAQTALESFAGMARHPGYKKKNICVNIVVSRWNLSKNINAGIATNVINISKNYFPLKKHFDMQHF